MQFREGESQCARRPNFGQQAPGASSARAGFDRGLDRLTLQIVEVGQQSLAVALLVCRAATLEGFSEGAQVFKVDLERRRKRDDLGELKVALTGLASVSAS